MRINRCEVGAWDECPYHDSCISSSYILPFLDAAHIYIEEKEFFAIKVKWKDKTAVPCSCGISCGIIFHTCSTPYYLLFPIPWPGKCLTHLPQKTVWSPNPASGLFLIEWLVTLHGLFPWVRKRSHRCLVLSSTIRVRPVSMPASTSISTSNEVAASDPGEGRKATASEGIVAAANVRWPEIPLGGGTYFLVFWSRFVTVWPEPRIHRYISGSAWLCAGTISGREFISCP